MAPDLQPARVASYHALSPDWGEFGRLVRVRPNRLGSP